MAIQVRRGLMKDFDPYKMLPGEWAVSIDPSSSNQIVWMCFAPGVCKRMGTYEDFVAQITDATDDIREQYVNEFSAILTDVQSLADTVSADKETVVIAKSDIVDTYIPQIQKYVNDAKAAASTAVSKASDALEYSTLSKSYAVGGTGTRDGEDRDNAEYYYQQAKSTAESLGSPINPQGTVAFEDLPPLSEVGLNWMYNISNEFVTTEDFVEGAGNVMPLGTNVYKTASGKWDCFAGSPVTGIKGNKETTYRKGNVNITPANIGALEEDGDSKDNTVSFTSGDSTNPTGWADINLVESGETHSSLFRKFSLAIKNLRYLYKMLGTTDISAIGDGTATGAISTLNSNLKAANIGIANVSFANSITNWHHAQNTLLFNELRLSFGISVPSEIAGWGTIATISEGYRGSFSSSVIIISSKSDAVYCGYYNASNGTIGLFSATLPAGNYLVISA